MMIEKIEWYRAIEFLVFIIPRTLVISYTPYLDMVLNEEVRIDGKKMKRLFNRVKILSVDKEIKRE